jgi:flagellar biosynthesis regulator FlbT
MHEGYIKSQGQFSLESPEAVLTAGAVMVVNPRMLLEQIEAAFSEYCDLFTAAQAKQLARQLHRYFDAEVKAAKPAGAQEQTDDPHSTSG